MITLYFILICHMCDSENMLKPHRNPRTDAFYSNEKSPINHQLSTIYQAYFIHVPMGHAPWHNPPKSSHPPGQWKPSGTTKGRASGGPALICDDPLDHCWPWNLDDHRDLFHQHLDFIIKKWIICVITSSNFNGVSKRNTGAIDTVYSSFMIVLHIYIYV